MSLRICSGILLTICLLTVVLSSTISSQGLVKKGVQLSPVTSRQLQTLKIADNQQITIDFDSLVARVNKIRTSLNLTSLSANARLNQIIKQWSASLRTRMSLVLYLQIFGIIDIRVY